MRTSTEAMPLWTVPGTTGRTDPPHRANLLNSDNTAVGIGVYQVGRLTYYTMRIGAPPSSGSRRVLRVDVQTEPWS